MRSSTGCLPAGFPSFLTSPSGGFAHKVPADKMIGIHGCAVGWLFLNIVRTDCLNNSLHCRHL